MPKLVNWLDRRSPWLVAPLASVLGAAVGTAMFAGQLWLGSTVGAWIG